MSGIINLFRGLVNDADLLAASTMSDRKGLLTMKPAKLEYPEIIGGQEALINYTAWVSSANTWEYKTITIAGDTSGTWLTTNGNGMNLRVTMGSGSTRLSTGGSWQAGNYDGVTGTTSVVGTNGATFYITGVQLEKGSTATSFDYRPYGTEFNLTASNISASGFISGSSLNITNDGTINGDLIVNGGDIIVSYLRRFK